jgi:uncharacterized protein
VIAYFDTSALIKLLIDEDGTPLADRLWDEAEAVVTSQLAYPEARAALAAARRARRLTARQLADAKRGLEERWREVRAIDVRPELAIRAGVLAEHHALRGYDAVHLASALAVSSLAPTVVTWDAALAEAAQNEQLASAPAR